MTDAFDYVKASGQCSSSDYPYTGRDGKCQASGCEAKTFVDQQFHVLPGLNEEMMTAIAQEPVAVAVACLLYTSPSPRDS